MLNLTKMSYYLRFIHFYKEVCEMYGIAIDVTMFSI